MEATSDEEETTKETKASDEEDSEDAFPATQDDDSVNSGPDDDEPAGAGALVPLDEDAAAVHKPSSQLALALLDNEAQAEETRNSS